jgi:hypothetical protein
LLSAIKSHDVESQPEVDGGRWNLSSGEGGQSYFNQLCEESFDFIISHFEMLSSCQFDDCVSPFSPICIRAVENLPFFIAIEGFSQSSKVFGVRSCSRSRCFRPVLFAPLGSWEMSGLGVGEARPE